MRATMDRDGDRPARGATRSDDIYRRLRDDIVDGALEPGASLPFAALRERYDASMGVLREVLTRLSAEGLASNQAQHGFRVMDLSLEDLEELVDARCRIEAWVLADSIENGDLDWEAKIVAAHHKMERTPKEDPPNGILVTRAWSSAHEAFHAALCSAAKNRRLAEIAATLRVSAEVYRRWSVPLEAPKRDVPAEHRELLELSLARRGEDAAEALRRHLRRTQEVILNSPLLRDGALRRDAKA